MDATSSYNAATKIAQNPEESISDIFSQVTTIPSPPEPGFQTDLEIANNQSGGNGGSQKASGIRLFPNTASEVFISTTTILDSYDPTSDDDWSVNLTISSGVFNGTIAYSSDTALYNATGSSQTVYRIPIVRDEVFVATYGAYAEKTVCINGESVVQFIHI